MTEFPVKITTSVCIGMIEILKQWFHYTESFINVYRAAREKTVGSVKTV